MKKFYQMDVGGGSAMSDIVAPASAHTRDASRRIAARTDICHLTPERRQHHDIRKEGPARRVITTVQALRNAGDIGDDEVAAAWRWYQTYIFGVHGYHDSVHDRGANYIKGDMHTWMINRARAKGQIGRVRDALGLCAHIRLEMMLIHEKSFSAMGSALYPALSEARSRTKLSSQCGLLLEQLKDIFRRFDREDKAAKNSGSTPVRGEVLAS
jgi:hypothetical protein